MAAIFLLGPSMWDAARKESGGHDPIQIRREIAKTLRRDGHKVILMEDDPDRTGEDLIQKFDRLLRQGTTDVVVYWPPLAKMQTTYDELILLCDRRVFLQKNGIAIWLLHHANVAEISTEAINILETGNRSRYLTAVVKLGVRPLKWKDHDGLLEKVRLLAAELQ